ncbi:MAG: polyhydroxyalkanoate synthesis regulator DNA-binding domain-containing protein [Myxococcota bacterium]
METEPKDAEVGERRLVKRYANRKLYDTRDSRYVTLQQIAEFVRDGEDVCIVDNRSKEDLTSVTLAQIIYEEEKKGEASGRRARSLRDFIQEGRDFIQEGRERIITTLRDSPVTKLVARREDGEEAEDVDAETAEVTGSTPAAPEESTRRWIITSPKEAFEELSRLADDRLRALLGGAVTHIQQLQSEVRRLQTRIDEVEKHLTIAARRRQPPQEEQPNVSEPSTARESRPSSSSAVAETCNSDGGV